MAILEGLDLEAEPRPHRFTVDEYLRMAEVGLLDPDARVELIGGVIYDMAPIGVLHAGTVAWMHRELQRGVGDRAIVFDQTSLRLNVGTMPEPDLALLKPREDFYTRSGGASPADVLLMVEVSDSSLRYDLDTKMPLYARHGIPEAWVVDLPHKQMHVHRAPVAGRYTDVTVTAAPGVVHPVALPQVAVDLGLLFALG